MNLSVECLGQTFQSEACWFLVPRLDYYSFGTYFRDKKKNSLKYTSKKCLVVLLSC